MQLAIGSDQFGADIKERLELYLIECGYVVEDFDENQWENSSFPSVVHRIAVAVGSGEIDRGIVVGRSAHAEAILANRSSGVRCTVCWNRRSARASRREVDSNLLAISCEESNFEQIRSITECWLETRFENHRLRQELADLEYLANKHVPTRTNGRLPHRTDFVQEGVVLCESCREEFRIPVDISAGQEQELLEECPVCCHENLVVLHFEDDGALTITGDRDITW